MKFKIYFYASSFKTFLEKDFMDFKLTDNTMEAETVEEAEETVKEMVDSFNRVFGPKNIMFSSSFEPRTSSFVVKMGINPDWKKDDSQQE